MYTCNRENMTKLVEALESEEYTQTTGQLRSEYGFCCLGVACDISGLGEWTLENGIYFYNDGEGDFDCSTLPHGVIEQLELNANEAQFTEQLPLTTDGNFDTGSDMNDNGFAFADIAAEIRKAYLEGNDQ